MDYLSTTEKLCRFMEWVCRDCQCDKCSVKSQCQQVFDREIDRTEYGDLREKEYTQLIQTFQALKGYRISQLTAHDIISLGGKR